MKKALSLFLAVLMLFSCLAVNASAYQSDYHGEGKVATNEQCVVIFNPAGGKFQDAITTYDKNLDNPYISYAANEYTGTYVMVPRSTTEMKPGSQIMLPMMTPQSGYAFKGWECRGYQSGKATSYYGQPFVGGWIFTLPEDCAGEVLQFTAIYSAAEPEEDTMAKVMGIMIKIFGAIIGILMYQGDTEAGVALMEKVLGGLL